MHRKRSCRIANASSGNKNLLSAESFHLAKPCIFYNAAAVSSSNKTMGNLYSVELTAIKSNEDCKSFVSTTGLFNSI